MSTLRLRPCIDAIQGLCNEHEMEGSITLLRNTRPTEHAAEFHFSKTHSSCGIGLIQIFGQGHSSQLHSDGTLGVASGKSAVARNNVSGERLLGSARAVIVTTSRCCLRVPVPTAPAGGLPKRSSKHKRNKLQGEKLLKGQVFTTNPTTLRYAQSASETVAAFFVLAASLSRISLNMSMLYPVRIIAKPL